MTRGRPSHPASFYEYASLLDRAALTAIQRWKFNPALRNGEAVPGTVRVPVIFRLQ